MSRPCSCGAAVKHEIGSVHNPSYVEWECGAVHDDGPGVACPNQPITTTKDEPKMQFAITEQAEPTTAPEPKKDQPLEVLISEWSAQEVELRALAATADGITVAGHTEGAKAGREAVHGVLMPIWKAGCAIENRRKELLEGPKKLVTQINDTARRLDAIVSPVEKALRADRDAYDAAQEKIKADAAAEVARLAQVERERLDKLLDDRVYEVATLGGTISVAWLRTCSDEAYAATVADLTAQREDRLKCEAEDLAERIRLEEVAAEARRVEDQRRAEQDAADLLARQVAQAREDAERRKRQAEEDEAAEVARVERQKQQDADAAAARAERDRLQAIADEQAEVARVEAARLAVIAAEQAKAQAEIDRQREELAEAKRRDDAAKATADAERQREADAKAEAVRVEARRVAAAAQAEREKPDRERATAWCEAVMMALQNVPEIADMVIGESVTEAKNAAARVIAELSAEMCVGGDK